VAVVAGIGHHENHIADASIATRQPGAPLNRLNVADPRLGVNGTPPSHPVDDAVPRAEVARDAERDLEPQPEARRQDGSQPLEERELRRLADWLAVPERPERHVQSERGADEGEGLVGDVRRQTALDPTQLGNRQPDRRAHLAEGHPGAKPDSAEVLADRDDVPTRELAAADEPALLSGHGDTMTIVGHRAVT